MPNLAIPQSVARRAIFWAFLSSDHITTATGKTIAVTISKNGAAFGNPSAGATNATELSGGWYYVDLSTTDTGTLGPLVLRGTSSGVDDIGLVWQVVSAHNAGFDGVPDIIAGASTGLPLAVDASGRVDVLKVNGTSQTARDLGATLGVAGAGLTALGDTRIANLDAAVTTRMATYTQPTGFLAATFPGTVASTTNITAGTITTVTNLTNAPTAGDLTATMKTSVTTAATAATPTAAAVTAGVTLTTGERNSVADAILARAITAESYPATGAVPTLSQALYMLLSELGQFSITGTTLTCKKLDGTTTSMTFTLDSATTPTSRVRAT